MNHCPIGPIAKLKSPARKRIATAPTSERFAAALRETVARFEEKIDNIGRDQKQERGAIYKRIDDMAQNVTHIKGYLFRKGNMPDPESHL